ncbi:MAG: LLM class flavin-dependent oxidoreductase [Chloroflexota bacterium]|nr:LLM class flavin-dependent oxidoreductase [Chloroflexota bacterium]
MQTDLLLMPFGATYPQMRDAAVVAEEAGFDGIWTWDHLRDADYNSGRVPEALVTLTGIAEATSRVMLGTLVLNVANRHPGLLANMAATLQEVSDNRFILGLGAGGGPSLPYAPEQTMLGRPVPPDRVRAAQVAEAAQVLRHLWSGERTTFDGEHFQLRAAHGFNRPEVPPPIVVGGWGPRMAGIAGRHADGFNTQAGHPQLTAFAEIARREHAASGRNPDDFLLTVFAGLSEPYVRADGSARAALEQKGVDRLILLTTPPYYLEEIREAGRMLAT